MFRIKNIMKFSTILSKNIEQEFTCNSKKVLKEFENEFDKVY